MRSARRRRRCPIRGRGRRRRAARLSPEGLARTVAALMPEDAVVVDESVTYGRGFFPETYAAPAHDWLQIAAAPSATACRSRPGAAIGARGGG